MLDSFYVVPGYTFFYWGFTLPKKEYINYTRYFRLSHGPQNRDIILIINNRKYAAKIRLVKEKAGAHWKARNVVQIFYNRETTTLKALRKLFMYSYAATINKAKPKLKEIMELEHVKGNIFIVRTLSKQQTDFDPMFEFMEDKNLFDYLKDSKANKPRGLFVDVSRVWLPVEKLKNYKNRSNVVYLLYHTKKNYLYVGKANRLGERVKQGKGRLGMPADWDKFMFFEIDPEYAPFIEQIEAFAIRSFATLFENDVGMTPLRSKNVKLVNRQLINK